MTIVDTPSDRAGYLTEVTERLWPAPAKVVMGTASDNSATVEFLVLPDFRHARLVLPLRSRRAAAAMALRYTEPRSLAHKARAHAMSLAASTGALQAVFRDRIRVELPAGDVDTIETVLSEIVGRPVAVGMHVTSPRANRKPVLQALADDGTLLAVAKVATDDLTRDLVANEATALRRLGAADARTFTVPTLLNLRSWRGLDVLTLSALPLHEPRVEPEHTRLAAVANEIADTGGRQRTTLESSGYVDRLRERIAMLRPDAAHRLGSALDRALGAHGGLRLSFGAWHGDFTIHNLAFLPDDVLVWDWERYDDGVPVGFDLVHHHVQQHLLAPDVDVAAFVHGLDRATPPLLAPAGLTEREATAVTRMYLLEIAARYVADRQDEVGRLGEVLPELLDVLSRR